VSVVGVSFDTPESNASWAANEGFQFELWTDVDKTLAITYGAATSTDATFPMRTTRLLDSDGAVLLEYVQVDDINAHPSQVLADCQALFGTE